MKYILMVFIVFYYGNVFGDNKFKLGNINQFIWKNRLLIIWSDQPQKDLNTIINHFRGEIADRNMIIFTINETQISTNYSGNIGSQVLTNLKVNFPQAKGRYFLVGKDGGLKNYGEVLDLEFILTEIDSMPMRKQEIKNQIQN